MAKALCLILIGMILVIGAHSIHQSIVIENQKQTIEQLWIGCQYEN